MSSNKIRQTLKCLPCYHCSCDLWIVVTNTYQRYMSKAAYISVYCVDPPLSKLPTHVHRWPGSIGAAIWTVPTDRPISVQEIRSSSKRGGRTYLQPATFLKVLIVSSNGFERNNYDSWQREKCMIGIAQGIKAFYWPCQHLCFRVSLRKIPGRANVTAHVIEQFCCGATYLLG